MVLMSNGLRTFPFHPSSQMSGLSFPLSFLVMIRLILEINPEIKDWLYQTPRVSMHECESVV